ncbi:MAG: hypothetical protein PW843_24625 [Azospirillaceae bacterium]|nr:hypothetical protein [Azospirillaceae bacterium]
MTLTSEQRSFLAPYLHALGLTADSLSEHSLGPDTHEGPMVVSDDPARDNLGSVPHPLTGIYATAENIVITAQNPLIIDSSVPVSLIFNAMLIQSGGYIQANTTVKITATVISATTGTSNDANIRITSLNGTSPPSGAPGRPGGAGTSFFPGTCGGGNNQSCVANPIAPTDGGTGGNAPPVNGGGPGVAAGDFVVQVNFISGTFQVQVTGGGGGQGGQGGTGGPGGAGGTGGTAVGCCGGAVFPGGKGGQGGNGADGGAGGDGAPSGPTVQVFYSATNDSQWSYDASQFGAGGTGGAPGAAGAPGIGNGDYGWGSGGTAGAPGIPTPPDQRGQVIIQQS